MMGPFVFEAVLQDALGCEEQHVPALLFVRCHLQVVVCHGPVSQDFVILLAGLALASMAMQVPSLSLVAILALMLLVVAYTELRPRAA